jgi:hypothetical protein
MTTPLVSHDDVVAVVTRWRDTHGASSSVLTRSFVDDVCGGRDLERWQDVRAEDVFVFVSPRPRMLLAVRSAIVLLPILLTWLALSQVIDPYATYVQNVDSSANYLWFWQSNPEGAFASHWRLSHVALVDAGLIAALVVLSVRISWHETAVLERDEREYDELIQVVNVYVAQYQAVQQVLPMREQPEPSLQHQSPPKLHQELAPQ